MDARVKALALPSLIAVSCLIALPVITACRPPAPPTTPPIISTPFALSLTGSTRFAVIGDYGAQTDAERDVANQVKSWNPDFIITTGDNNYPDGAASTIDANIGRYYHQFIYPYVGSYGEGATTNRFFPSLGNHDWNTTGARPYLDYFTLPNNERYYDFTWGPLHLFAVDSDSREPDGVSASSTQAAWVRDQLAGSTAPWKLVYMHHPPYSSGSHGSTPRMQWPYRQWGASAVLAGHDHTYERIVRDGFPYFVNGLGGRSIYDFKALVEGSEVRYNDDYGAMLVEASDSSITFRFINRAGSLIDSYSLQSTLPTPTSTAPRAATATPTDVAAASATATTQIVAGPTFAYPGLAANCR